MAARKTANRKPITAAVVRNLKPAVEPHILWDSNLAGFWDLHREARAIVDRAAPGRHREAPQADAGEGQRHEPKGCEGGCIGLHRRRRRRGGPTPCHRGRSGRAVQDGGGPQPPPHRKDGRADGDRVPAPDRSLHPPRHRRTPSGQGPPARCRGDGTALGACRSEQGARAHPQAVQKKRRIGNGSPPGETLRSQSTRPRRLPGTACWQRTR